MQFTTHPEAKALMTARSKGQPQHHLRNTTTAWHNRWQWTGPLQGTNAKNMTNTRSHTKTRNIRPWQKDKETLNSNKEQTVRPQTTENLQTLHDTCNSQEQNEENFNHEEQQDNTSQGIQTSLPHVDTQNNEKENEKSNSVPLQRAQQIWQSILRHPTKTGFARRSTSLSTSNLMRNVVWGDTLQEKTDGTLRICSTNTNGISLKNDELTTIVSETSRAGIDLFLLQEHILELSNHKTLSSVHNTVKTFWKTPKTSHAQSDTQFDTNHKPGGTMTLVAPTATSRHQQTMSDSMGRWIVTKLNGKQGHVLNVVNIHHCIDCGNIHCAKSMSVYAQQWAMLHVTQKEPNPIQQFSHDLEAMLSLMLQKNEDILLAGDFNEELGGDSGPVAKVIAKLSLIDLANHKHTLDHEAPTQARGSKRLDCMLGTPRVAASMKKCGHEPFGFQHR